MKIINSQMIVAVVIHAIITLAISFDSHYYPVAFLSGAIVLANLLGLFLISARQIKIGAKIFLISSAILVPIGMIGVLGARKILEEEEKKKFYNQN